MTISITSGGFDSSRFLPAPTDLESARRASELNREVERRIAEEEAFSVSERRRAGADSERSFSRRRAEQDRLQSERESQRERDRVGLAGGAGASFGVVESESVPIEGEAVYDYSFYFGNTDPFSGFYFFEQNAAEFSGLFEVDNERALQTYSIYSSPTPALNVGTAVDLIG